MEFKSSRRVLTPYGQSKGLILIADEVCEKGFMHEEFRSSRDIVGSLQ